MLMSPQMLYQLVVLNGNLWGLAIFVFPVYGKILEKSSVARCTHHLLWVISPIFVYILV